MINLQQLKQRVVNAGNTATLLQNKRAATELHAAAILLSAVEGASQEDEPAQSTDIDKTIFTNRTKEELIAEVDSLIGEYISTMDGLGDDTQEIVGLFFSHSFVRVVTANGLLKW